MSKEKINLYIGNFTVKKIPDPALKAPTSQLARKLAANFIDKTKFNLIRKDKSKQGFTMNGTLALVQDGQKLKVALVLDIATWPKKSAFGFAPKVGAVGDILGELDIGDVEATLKDLFEALVKKVMVALQNQAKKMPKAKSKANA